MSSMWDREDQLEVTIYQICGELIEQDWWLTDDGLEMPPPDGFFPSLLRRHLRPLVDDEAYRRARIAALKAELAELERA